MPQQIIANAAAVATGHQLGADAGLEMLKDGGNAVDAAVAAMLALCVVIPGSVGIGGYGGSAVLVSPKQRAPGAMATARSGHAQVAPQSPRVIAIDFDSPHPVCFREGLVTAERESNYYGARAVTVPAVVAGLDLILREFGTKSWAEVSQPAIRLANEGFSFDAEHDRHYKRCAPQFDAQSHASLFPGMGTPKIGDLWRQPDLGRLLARIANEGPSTFYEGDIPHSIVKYLTERGGILSEEDFRTYRPQIVDATSARCRDCELFTPPPPSGGITSLAIVQTMERLLRSESHDLNLDHSEPWTAAYFHLLAETTKHCWHERYEHFGDPDSINIPFEQLVSAHAADERAKFVRHSDAKIPTLPSNPHTANVVAVDADGTLISLTATQGWMYGSHLVVDGMGLVFNHGMSRFDYSPGHPNAPAAGKRMQHNMSPLIALRDGRPAFAYGLPGGPKIVNVTAQLVLDTILFGATPVESIIAPRLHTDGNEPLLVSTHMPDKVIAQLESRGHTIRRESDMGGPVNVLAIDPESGQIDIASGEFPGAVAGIL